MSGRKPKLVGDKLEWARARYAEQQKALTVVQIAERVGVTTTTLLLSLFPERRMRVKALRILNDKPVRRRVSKRQEGASA